VLVNVQTNPVNLHFVIPICARGSTHKGFQLKALSNKTKTQTQSTSARNWLPNIRTFITCYSFILLCLKESN